MNLQSKNIKNGIVKALYVLLPIVAAVMFTLLPYVGVAGSVVFGTSFIVTSLLTSGLLLMFYFPARSLFQDIFMSSKRITSKNFEYSVRATVAYNHLKDLDNFCEWEFEHRKEKYIDRNLQLVDFGFKDFVERYKFEPKLIKSDDTLSKRQKRSLLKLTYTIKLVKKQDYEKLLPGAEFGTQFIRVKSSMNKSARIKSSLKVIKTMILGVATVSMVFTTNFDVGTKEIVMQILVRLGAGLWQIFTAAAAANELVNRRYFSELSEKNIFLDEFIEHYDYKKERDNIASNAKDTDYAVIVVQNIVERKPEAPVGEVRTVPMESEVNYGDR